MNRTIPSRYALMHLDKVLKIVGPTLNTLYEVGAEVALKEGRFTVMAKTWNSALDSYVVIMEPKNG